MSRGTAIYSDKGQKWLTRRHRQKDLALELLGSLSNVVVYTGQKYFLSGFS